MGMCCVVMVTVGEAGLLFSLSSAGVVWKRLSDCVEEASLLSSTGLMMNRDGGAAA